MKSLFEGTAHTVAYLEEAIVVAPYNDNMVATKSLNMLLRHRQFPFALVIKYTVVQLP